jgi:hypothetical protein
MPEGLDFSPSAGFNSHIPRMRDHDEHRTGVDPDQGAAGKPHVSFVMSVNHGVRHGQNAIGRGFVNSDFSLIRVAISTKVDVAMLRIRKMIRRFVRWLDWELGC